jgi:hypothetical protein
MTPPRFRLRTLLFAVAVVAVVLGSGIEAARLGRLARAYRQQAARHERLRVRCSHLGEETIDRFLFGVHHRPPSEVRRPGLDDARGRFTLTVEDYDPDWVSEYGRAEVAYEIRGWGREAIRHARLKEKYLRAAARPWLPVEPDPPEPD